MNFMKKRFRILAAALALCMSLLCCPAALAATDTSTFQTVPYSQATAQPSGQRITITGKPNYSAATSNDTAFIFGFDTADGVWYVAVKKSKFEAFKAAAPAQQMTLYGVYAGTLNVNGMPILDIQNGAVTLGDKTSEIADLYAAGQKTLDAQKAASQAAAKASSGTSRTSTSSSATIKKSTSTTQSKKNTSTASSGKKTGQMVWIPTISGHKYHSNPRCSGMKGPEKVDISTAKARGFTACKKCYR